MSRLKKKIDMSDINYLRNFFIGETIWLDFRRSILIYKIHSELGNVLGMLDVT